MNIEGSYVSYPQKVSSSPSVEKLFPNPKSIILIHLFSSSSRFSVEMGSRERGGGGVK